MAATGAYAVPTHWTEILFAGLGAKAKLSGTGEPCTWAQVFSAGGERRRMLERSEEIFAQVKPGRVDEEFGIQEMISPEGTFWLRRDGSQFNGRQLLAYLLAEHEWMRNYAPQRSVKTGDVVIDAGAHVGVFTRLAVKWGAAKVLAIEPDPVNRECLRRNLAAEIAAGKVEIAAVAVWSAPGKMTLHFGGENSGMSSLIENAGKGGVEVDLKTIDTLAEEHHLGRVSFIKMDIEGAEREALKGAAATIKASKPAFLLDSYHRTDDMAVLPKIIQAEANGAYQVLCGPCEPNVHDLSRFNPHMTYYY